MRNPLSLIPRSRPRITELVDKAPIPYVSRGAGGGLPWYRSGGTESQMRAMGSVGTLFSIVDRLASSQAAVEWALFRTAQPGEGPEDREPVTRHLALDIWNRPNPFFTSSLFVETFDQHYELVGEAWWVIARSSLVRSVPLELWPVMPHRIHPIPDPDEYLAGYMYIGPDGQQIPLRLDEVIHLRRPNPIDPYRGIGPVQTILSDLEGVRLSAEWNRNFFLNSAEPGGIVEIERRLSDDEYDEMVARWREQHQGTANAHRVAMLEGGAKWVDRSYSRRDMQFTEMRSVSSSVIREAFGIPKFAVGDVEDVNRATAEASKAWFAEQMTVPRAERIKDALNSQFLPMFGTAGQGVEFDFVSPVPADRAAEDAERTSKATAFKTYIDAGVDPEDAAEVVGLPPMRVKEIAPPPAPGAAPPGPGQPELEPGDDDQEQQEEPPALPAAARLDVHHHFPGPGNPLPVAGNGNGQPVDVETLSVFDLARAQARRARPAIALPRAAAEADEDEEGEQELPDVAHLQDSWERALEDLLEAWGPISEAQQDALVDQVLEMSADGDLSDLKDLAPPTDEAEEALTAALVALAGEAAQQAADEAADQDVEIPVGEPDEEELAAVAAATAALLAGALAASASSEALRVSSGEATPKQIADAVREHLGSLTDAQPRQRLGASLTTAQNKGRAATFAAAEEKHKGQKAAPTVAYYASEKNDKNTCKPCRKIDGKWLGNSLAEALAEYPTGGYVRCEGRDRCRGTYVSRWRPKQVKKD
ncbi:phage portal protein [Actinomadura sp. 21ATH]|uniref:phage portal protein n=1 Tax=Actinomadura sp. 21ATH TaxID=1735444 RepID=UPI0035C0F0A8